MRKIAAQKSLQSDWRRSTHSGAFMDNNSSTEINVEEIMLRIKKEVARKKNVRIASRVSDSSQGGGGSLSMSSVTVQASPVFSFIKRVQVIATKLPFYPLVYRFAVKFKRFIPRSMEVLSLEDLCAYEDESFIIAAYRLLLSRNPDDAGLDHYLTLLRSGRISKVEIIGRIRYSRDGRRGQVRVKGLCLRYACAILSKTPIAGRLFR